ncbi:ATP-binding protein [Tenacibaculum xiamenense]|uniref:ATP-binding protein n=1 Tax=Tenacibaculum xiamenense TaxID=1261553 RepID=UPI0038B43F35
MLLFVFLFQPYVYSSIAKHKNHYDIASDSLSIELKYDHALKKFEKKNLADALKEALNIRNICKERGTNDELLFKTTLLIGSIYSSSNNRKLSLKYFLESLKILEKISFEIENKNNIKKNYSNEFSKVYLKTGAAYLKMYKDIKYDQKENLNNRLREIGVSREKLKNSAELYAKSKIFRDSALFFFNKLESMISINETVQMSKASSYINLSGLYQIDSMFNEAEKYTTKAINIYKKVGKKLKLAKTYSNLGSIYLSTGDPIKAKQTYYKGINVIKTDTSESAVKQKAVLYFNLAWAMRTLEDYKAYDNLEIYYEIEDFLKEKDLKKYIKKAENQHNETIKKLENDRKVAIAKAELEKENTDLMLAGLSLLILIISGVVIYNIKLRQRNLKLKLEQNKLVEKQKIDHLKSEAQVKILNATIDGKETERKQIAETLHDSVSALLSSANMHLRATKKQFNGSTPVELEKTQDIILEASQKVRDLSHNLVSSILLKFGLEYAIKDIAKKYSNRELEFHTEISNVDRYSQEFEIKLYNVIHELINNIIKHSKASNAYIIIEERNDFLSVRIEDDGIGFDYKTSNSSSGGLGLNQIEARIQIMNGNFLVESGVNQGSKITFSVPIQKKSQTSFV